MVCAQMFLSGNPALSERSFFVFPIICDDSTAMTLSGTVNKTAFSLVILSATASYVWNRGPGGPLDGRVEDRGHVRRLRRRHGHGLQAVVGASVNLYIIAWVTSRA